VQQAVSAGTIQPRQVAVLRGYVTDRSGSGIGGVRVSLLGHPEFGYTDTRSDGHYDLAVNGGGPMTVSFDRQGYIPAQRMVQAPWEDYANVDPVALVPYDPQSTQIDPRSSNSFEVATATTQTDADGTRTERLLFAQGTQVTAVVNGASEPVNPPFRVRATEFTVGADGPAQMPAQLPPTTGYTYMAEFTIDQAVAAGATSVSFSKPVISYLEDYLGFPVGTHLPLGSYDRQTGVWTGSGRRGAEDPVGERRHRPARPDGIGQRGNGGAVRGRRHHRRRAH
jgi:hypothetical protein